MAYLSFWKLLFKTQMADRKVENSLPVVKLTMDFEWKTNVNPTKLKKSVLFSHSALVGVEWQVHLWNNSQRLVMVSNKHYKELKVTFTIRVPHYIKTQSKTSVLTNQQRDIILNFHKSGGDEAKLYCCIEVAVPQSMDFPPDRVTNGFENLLSTRFQSDVDFYVNGKTIPAHKLLLAAKSPAFRRMFYDQGDDSNVVHVDDVSAEAFEAFLRLVYTGKIDDDALRKGGIALEVMSLGHKYQVKSAVRRASLAMQESLTNETVLQAVEASRQCEDKELEEACANFVAANDNLKKVSEQETWSTFISRNTSFISNVMSKIRGNFE